MLNVFALLQINLVILTLFLIIWNKIEQPLPFKKLTMLLLASNIAIIAFWIGGDFSLIQIATDWSQTFRVSITNWYIYCVIFISIFLGLFIPFIYQQLKQLALPHNKIYRLFAIGLFFIVLGIWIPFGFDSKPYLEIWVIQDFFMFGPPQPLNDEMITRLSILIPHTIVHLLDSQGYVAYNLLHFILTLAKGYLLFAILKKFNFDDITTLFITLLFVFYPTQTEAYALRNITILFSIVIFLLAIFIFLTFRENPTSHNLLAFVISMFFSVTFNEYAFLHIVFFPLAILYLESRITHKWLNLSLLWYLVPAGYICYYYIMSTVTTVYTSGFANPSLFDVDVGKIFRLARNTVQDLFLTNWLQTLNISLDSIPHILVTLVAIGLTFGIAHQFIKSNQQPPTISHTRIAKVIIASLVIILLASAIFGIFERQNSQWRIFGLSSIGASILIGSLITFLVTKFFQKHYQKALLAIIVVIMALAYSYTLNRYGFYWQIANNKAKFLEPFSEYTNISSDAYWVFFTDIQEDTLKAELTYFVTPFDDVRDSALKIVMQDPSIKSHICYLPLKNCRFHTQRLVTWRNSISPEVATRYKDIVFFWIHPDLSVELIDDLPADPWQFSYAEETYRPYSHIALKSQ